MRKRVLLAGPVLLGFSAWFDESWGRPSADPLPVLAPTCIGGVPLYDYVKREGGKLPPCGK